MISRVLLPTPCSVMKAIVPIRGSGLSVRRLLLAVPCASSRCFSLLLVHDQRLDRSKLRSSKAERCCIVPTLSPADGSADSVIRLLSHVCGCSPSLSLNPPRPNGKKVCAPRIGYLAAPSLLTRRKTCLVACHSVAIHTFSSVTNSHHAHLGVKSGKFRPWHTAGSRPVLRASPFAAQ